MAFQNADDVDGGESGNLQLWSFQLGQSGYQIGVDTNGQCQRNLVLTQRNGPSGPLRTVKEKSVYSAELVHPTRFELVASAFGGQRSIQLSYGCRTPAN